MEQNHQEFVAGVTRLLSQREGCGVMVIIDGPNGLEIASTSPSFSFHFGILDAAKLTVGMNYQRASEESIRSGQTAAIIKDIANTVDGKEEKPN